MCRLDVVIVINCCLGSTAGPFTEDQRAMTLMFLPLEILSDLETHSDILCHLLISQICCGLTRLLFASELQGDFKIFSTLFDSLIG